MSWACSGIGFSFQSPDMSGPPKRPLGDQYPTFNPENAVPVAGDSGTVPDKPTDSNPAGVITLEQALFLGLFQNPELASFSWEVRAAEARLVQKGLFPNPEIETSIENFGGNDGHNGFNSAETTIQIHQMIELGGKRGKRRQVAALEKNITQWDYESKRLDVYADISKAFWEVIAAQEKSAIAAEIMAVTDDAYNLVAERVKAGKAPPLEELQSKVTVTKIRIEYEQAKRELETARKKLAATWGSPKPIFERVIADIRILAPPPPLESLEANLSKNPDLAGWDTEMEKHRRLIGLAAAERIPDLTVGAGPRYYNESDDVAFVMTASIPLPLFNRNQGGTMEARSNFAQIRESRKAAILKTQKDLDQAYQDFSSSYLTTISLLEIAIPAAQTAFSAALEGYREGKIGYLGVLETQRAFFEVKHQYISAIGDYHKSKADIERLTGQSLADNK